MQPNQPDATASHAPKARPTQATRAATPPAAPRRRRRGFTLVEILIVVLILAILAVMVVPQFGSASDETRENALKMNLFHIRQQIELYKHQHNSQWPELENFAEQMTQASNVAGQTAEPGTAGHPYGPYLRQVPNNPFTGDNEVGEGDFGTSDWYYNENTGEFRANHDEDYAEL